MKFLKFVVLISLFCFFVIQSQQDKNDNVKVDIQVYSDFSKKLLIPKEIKLNGKVLVNAIFQPGKYDLVICHPGYFDISKTVTIPKKEKIVLKEIMVAKPRTFSLKKVTALPLEIINTENNLPLSSKDKFKPGKSVELQFKFKGYKTVYKSFLITPGEGPYMGSVETTKLELFEFSGKKGFVLDGVEYSYEFYSDQTLIEQHHISVEQIEMGSSFRVYRVWCDPNAKNLRSYCGYLYSETPLSKLVSLGKPKRIDCERLVKHLKVLKNKKELLALQTLEKLCNSFLGKKRLKETDPSELDFLIRFVIQLKEDNSLYQDRWTKTLGVLEKIR